MVYIWVAVALVLYLVLAWFTGTWLHLTGSSLWTLRGLLALVGLAAAGLFVWWYRKVARKGGALAAQAESGTDEMDVLIRDALNRLRSSKQGVNLKQLPTIYVLGPGGTTKTTTITNSGLEPELLAGQVYQDSNIVPTRSVNLWYTRQALFVEAAGGLMEQPLRWIRLIRKLSAGKLSSAMGKGEQAPRAAVVCFDSEAFLRSGASEAIPAMARNLNARLQEVSQQLGINFPVYVLFTKMDRVSFFADYVRNLMRDEATQVLGATLPMRSAQSGIYAEEETKRLTKAFDELFFALADKRLDLLARESEQQPLAGIYEFPREWRKLRQLLVQFLVDLGRPSQLQATPFIRGFYFSGVRAVMVDDSAQAAMQAAATPQQDDLGGGATRMLSVAQVRAAAAQAAAAPRAIAAQKKVPQWVFLTHLFNDVILKDRAAMGASGFSSKVSGMRRVLLGAAAVVCLMLAVLFAVSFVENRSLESEVTTAARQLGTLQLAPGQFPAIEDLRRLEALRQTVQRLNEYARDGAPWHMRWGLYTGDTLLPDVRKVYFDRFHQMMFGTSQQALLAHLQKLPLAPEPTDEYFATYAALKAYLITTSNHDKSTVIFLAPVLMNRWLAGRPLDGERAGLAQRQFEFYANELIAENPYSSENDAAAVERARVYLSKFGAIERIYRSMLEAANTKNPSIVFRRVFPAAAEAVVDDKEVEGAFTKDGFAFMQDALAHSDRYFAGEEWVLGKQAAANLDRAAIEAQLRTRYRTDFIDQWRMFLRAGQVLNYRDAADASNKLTALSGPQSPLLALFWLAATHTAVSDADVANVFQPVQTVVAGGADRYVNPNNQGYLTGLSSLQVSMAKLAENPADKAGVDQVRGSASAALQSSRQVQLGFKPDTLGVAVRSAELLDAPIRNAERIAVPKPPDGSGICKLFAPLMSKFPFNPTSKVDASLAEVGQVFAPGAGAVAQFLAQNQAVLVRQGPQVMVNPTAGVKISPRLVEFLNRAVAFTDTVYPGNSPTPNLRFNLKPYTVEGIQALTFDSNGQKLVAPGSPQDFTWIGGETGQVRISGKLGGSDVTFLNYGGTWAVFHFFAEADRWQTQGNVHMVEWVPRSGQGGQPMIINNKPLTLRYDLQMAGAPVFQKAFLTSFRCAP
ncbi:MAG: ImcF-related family protein [Terriglobales bacterium]